MLVDLEARHGAALFGFVRRLGLSEPQAQDCVQEVLLRLWAEIGRGNAIDDPKAWAYRAIYRLAMDEHRLRRRIEALAHRLVERRDPIESEAPLTDHIAIWREIDRLPIRQRQVLYLRFRADLPFEDIATILDITASAARTHATLATRTIRSRLAEPDSGARRE
ncbi:MAG TPA: sigma-70 family RNA polymerase sigma factor [Candidatus Limnocylindrales bacterium]|nr:sigma-70 family RNA polymerase sigma factor [Candidatus Limnocylindrales bacterium]